MLGKILTFEDKFKGGLEAYVLNFVKVEHGDGVMRDSAACIHGAGMSPQSVPAVVNHGRWIVRCPTCSGAQFASRPDRRFFCSSCLNHASAHRWIGVEWPDDAVVHQIETILMRRPNPTNRNWEPGETVADLVRENGLRGHAEGI